MLFTVSSTSEGGGAHTGSPLYIYTTHPFIANFSISKATESMAFSRSIVSAATLIASTSTAGGVDYDTLCKGDVKNYSFNIVDLKNAETFDEILYTVKRRIRDTIANLEIQSGKEVDKFVIGKTYVRQKRKKGGFQEFDEMRPESFKKVGISKRWQQHKYRNYGKDGMIVVCIVTRPVAYNPQRYALILEEELQKSFRADHDDRLANSAAYRAGPEATSGAIGYPIYIAYSFLDQTR